MLLKYEIKNINLVALRKSYVKLEDTKTTVLFAKHEKLQFATKSTEKTILILLIIELVLFFRKYEIFMKACIC